MYRAVDCKRCGSKSMKEIQSMIVGPQGSTVRIDLKRLSGRFKGRSRGQENVKDDGVCDDNIVIHMMSMAMVILIVMVVVMMKEVEEDEEEVEEVFAMLMLMLMMLLFVLVVIDDDAGVVYFVDLVRRPLVGVSHRSTQATVKELHDLTPEQQAVLVTVHLCTIS